MRHALLYILLLLYLPAQASATIKVYLTVGEVKPDLDEGATVASGTKFSTGADGLIILEETWRASGVGGEICTGWILISGGKSEVVRSRKGKACEPTASLDEAINKAMNRQKAVSAVVFLGAGGKGDGFLDPDSVRARFEPLRQLKGVYSIRQQKTGKYVDAHETGNEDYRVVLRDLQRNNTQRWILTPVGRDLYRIQQKSTGRYVDAYGPGARAYQVVTRPSQCDNTQRWWVKWVGPRLYTIQQKSNDRYVDAYETSDQDFRLVTRPQQNNATQRWFIARE